ncbi:hypothetical protein RHGRI_005250 [Rhododendron griersonianum]|uniref:Uncharacterized protein n=1 Tax=Rhododendron griersonianum TaxID=479676 RepID=A0AAV6LER2_9ERIC|nr:hypothetical protein RHGRI_005250 [Rhododendron griersonianum]
MLTNGKEFNERMTFNLHESESHYVYFNGMLDTVLRHGHLSLSDVKVLSKRNSLAKDVGEALSLHDGMFRAGISTATETFSAHGKFAGGIVAPYTVYKGKAALSAAPVLPTFSKLDSGGLKVHRRGTIMLTFWPASGERKYDWEKRQRFALSATEVGSLISLASKDSCEFFHDPSMLSSNAGQVRKTLSCILSTSQEDKHERVDLPKCKYIFILMLSLYGFALLWLDALCFFLHVTTFPSPATSPQHVDSQISQKPYSSSGW